MSLPKISHPTFEVVIPSNRKKIKMRMMLVKEEKILLIAKEADSESDILLAIKQVVNNCIMDESIDINKLALFDIEYLFLKLRATSIDNKTKVSYRDNEDNEIYEFEIDLNSIEVKFPENVEKTIKVNDKINIVMKYPESSLLDDKTIFTEESTAEENLEKVIIKSIDKILDGDKIIDASTVSADELKEFIDSIDINSYQKIRDFMTKVPSLFHEIKYKNKNDNDRKIVLSTLNDFFTLR